MASASRIGTPELMSVPSVRMVRATIVFSTAGRLTGTLRSIVENVRPRFIEPNEFERDDDGEGTIGTIYQ